MGPVKVPDNRAASIEGRSPIVKVENLAAFACDFCSWFVPICRLNIPEYRLFRHFPGGKASVRSLIVSHNVGNNGSLVPTSS